MDLLLNDKHEYGSSDDDFDEETKEEFVNGVTKLSPRKDNTNPRITDNNNRHDNSTIVPSISNKNINEKGKRLLSLASVLPPRILAALTKQQQQRRNQNGALDGDYFNDEDEDDEDHDSSDVHNEKAVRDTEDSNSTSNFPNQTLPTTAKTTAATVGVARLKNNNIMDGNSTSISSFLQELRQVGFTNDGSNNINTKVSNDSSFPRSTGTPNSDTRKTIGTMTASQTNLFDSEQSQPPPNATKVSKLGDAFLQSSTTTTKSVKSKPIVIRNIHDDDFVTNADYDDDENEVTSQANHQIKSHIHDLAVSSMPTSTIVNRTDSDHRSRPKIAIRAAPLVNAALLPHPSMPLPSQQKSLSPINESQSNPTVAQEQRFLSRKEIERTLRRAGDNSIKNASIGSNGKIDDVWMNMAFTQTQQGVDPNMYAPNVIAAAQQQQLTSVSNNVSLIKNSTTHIYDPTLGTTVPYNASKSDTADATATKSVAVKGKGKNQINSLLAQAVALERERSEQQIQSTATSKTTQQVHRANAKRKYGW